MFTPTWPTPARYELQLIPDRKKALVVDRDEGLLYFCGYMLAQRKMSVYFANDASAAFRALAESSISLVVAEFESPIWSGTDLAHHMRTNYPNVPVILMTPFGETSGPASAVRGGATDYLVKPFSAEEFKSKLIAWERGEGAFSQWAKTESDGIPEQRSFHPNEEYLSSLQTKRVGRGNISEGASSKRLTVHEAIVADTARTLGQLIRRDIEEAALFSAISVDELRAAFLSEATGVESELLRQAEGRLRSENSGLTRNTPNKRGESLP
jgi:DNA-binding response OmpR family regulator